MAQKKTSTLTFRLNREIEKGLRKEAEEKRISLNILANQILEDHVQLEQYMEKFGVIAMSKKTFQSIIEKMSEKEIIELAIDIGSTEPRDFILFKWKDINAKSVLEFIKMYLEHCGYGDCDIEDSELLSISIHHKMGKKGSLFLKSFLESVIQSTLAKQPKAISTENSVTIRF